MSDPTPTRQLVREVLRKADCPLTPSQISRRVERSLRSVRGALRELEKEDLVTWRLDVNDARRRLYALTEESDDDPESGTAERGCEPSRGGSRR